ncbi:MAG: hypothetical protein JWQ66_2931 [Mucilaginibacter sp.]|nr:hypothetical protein [Mucilaginibacter sp.]
MRYLKIQNDGVLDIRLVALMGGTTKANDKFKIGQFGTGLKYTLAYLFRNNLDFKIFAGSDEVNIYTESETIKDEIFDIICINGNRTSITTRMGAEWSAWMIIRELWCNALDEGGSARDVVTECSGEQGKTVFYIQVDALIADVLKNWHNYFIHDQVAISETTQHKIYQGGETLRLYKNGVLIHEDTSYKSVFAYDIKDAEINELREFKGHVSHSVQWAIKQMNAKAVEVFLETISDEYYEGHMDYDWSYPSFDKTWTETIGNAKIIHKKAVEDIQAREAEIDLATVVIVPHSLYLALTKQFKGIGALRVADKINEFYEIHSEALSTKLNSALAILEVCEYAISPELQYIFGVFGDKTKLASVSLDKKEVWISDACLDRSLFDFCATLIEENEHFKTGHQDCTRSFQQHFINLYTKTLLDKNAIQI